MWEEVTGGSVEWEGGADGGVTWEGGSVVWGGGTDGSLLWEGVGENVVGGEGAVCGGVTGLGVV